MKRTRKMMAEDQQNREKGLKKRTFWTVAPNADWPGLEEKLDIYLTLTGDSRTNTILRALTEFLDRTLPRAQADFAKHAESIARRVAALQARGQASHGEPLQAE